MKTDLRHALRQLWHILTDVPGWPDAPVRKRARRALPILLPALATMLLLAWMFGVHDRSLRELHASHAGLIALEQEVDQLSQRYSDQHVATLAEQAASARRQVCASAAEASEFLSQLERDAARQGWKVNLRLGEVPESAAPGRQVVQATVRGRFTPAEDNLQPMSTLLSLLERYRSAPRRIELMRLSISADEARWHTVEVGFRIPILPSHAQTSQ